MSYPITVTKEMLMRLVTDNKANNIERITKAIMDRYTKLESLGNNGDEDEILDIMYADREKIDTTPETVPDWDEVEGEEQKKWIQKVIDAGLFKPKHGDGFHWLGDGYRNEGLWFWHKEKGIIPPCTEYDDYGSVPPCFLVGNGEDQFHPGHWTNVVDHNSYVFLAPELVDHIKSTAKPVTKVHKYTDNTYTVWNTSVSIKKRGKEIAEIPVQIFMEDISKMDNIFSFEPPEGDKKHGKLLKEEY
jgi:hypothetical protein